MDDSSERLKQEIRALRAKLEKKDDDKNCPYEDLELKILEIKDDDKNCPKDYRTPKNYWNWDVEQKIAFLEKEIQRLRERYGLLIEDDEDLQLRVGDLENDLDFYKTLKFHIDKVCDKLRADLLKEFSNIPRCPYDYIA
ncbi:hypothetical protein [Chlamydia suis]|uniref:hypothetical protein n=1 Tax=Chlamydia suis TaxID=83559 RepID=UPI0009B15C0A|nr:hypothetical protein [Chlamydia suis]